MNQLLEESNLWYNFFIRLRWIR